MSKKQEIFDQIHHIKTAVNASQPFAAEARALALVDLIREMPEVEQYRITPKPKLTNFDYLNTPDKT